MRRFLLILAVSAALYVGHQEFEEYVKVNSSPLQREAIAASVQTLAEIPRTTSSTAEVGERMGLTPLQVAEQYFNAHREEWKLQPHHEFRPVEFKTPLGTKIKYSTYQDGVPVLNLDISLQIERDNSVGAVENKYIPIEKAELKKKEMKVEELLPLVSERYTSVEEPKTLTTPVIVVVPGSTSPQVAYLLSVKDKARKEGPVEILFRASDGQVLGKNKPRSEF